MASSRFAKLSYGALVYDVGRHIACLIDDPGQPGRAWEGRPVPTSTLRVLTVLHGAWIADTFSECRPSTGVHDPDCPHNENRVSYSLRWLARMAFGSDGASQRRQVVDALTSLESHAVGYREHATNQLVRPLLSLETSGGDDPRAPHGVVSWNSRLLAALTAGHFQLIPIALVRGLKGRNAFRTWVYVLMKPGTAKIGRRGRFRDYAMTGPNGFGAEDVGLHRLGPTRLREALARHANAGNIAQTTFHLEVLERPCGGLKLRLTRPKPLQVHAARKNRRGSHPSRPAAGVWMLGVVA